MSTLMNIHPIVQEEIRNYFDLKPVQLKHPLPERPGRALGLMKIDGEVFSSDKLLRAVFIRPQLPVFFAVRSMFLRPRVQYDLPVFACEVMRTGSKKMLIVDIHRAGKTHHDDSALFAEMIKIRDRYPELTNYSKKQGGKVQEVFSVAACQISIPEALDAQAVSLIVEYLRLFCDMVKKAQPVAGDELRRTMAVFDDYLKSLIDHDPGVGVWKMIFGEKGGIERSMDMHFGM
ncbi:MAG: hypothetical protein JW832_00475 [Deltaproteobacteria bacterium]|nr:hypothetical protein [Deltaproteobacteria bacterium]